MLSSRWAAAAPSGLAGTGISGVSRAKASQIVASPWSSERPSVITSMLAGWVRPARAARITTGCRTRSTVLRPASIRNRESVDVMVSSSLTVNPIPKGRTACCPGRSVTRTSAGLENRKTCRSSAETGCRPSASSAVIASAATVSCASADSSRSFSLAERNSRIGASSSRRPNGAVSATKPPNGDHQSDCRSDASRAPPFESTTSRSITSTAGAGRVIAISSTAPTYGSRWCHLRHGGRGRAVPCMGVSAAGIIGCTAGWSSGSWRDVTIECYPAWSHDRQTRETAKA